MEFQKPGPGLACNQDFAEGGGFEPEVKKFYKSFEIRRGGEQSRTTQAYHKQGSGGGAASR